MFPFWCLCLYVVVLNEWVTLTMASVELSWTQSGHAKNGPDEQENYDFLMLYFFLDQSVTMIVVDGKSRIRNRSDRACPRWLRCLCVGTPNWCDKQWGRILFVCTMFVRQNSKLRQTMRENFAAAEDVVAKAERERGRDGESCPLQCSYVQEASKMPLYYLHILEIELIICHYKHRSAVLYAYIWSVTRPIQSIHPSNPTYSIWMFPAVLDCSECQ